MAAATTSPKATFTVRGRVFNSTTDAGLANMLVSIYDAPKTAAANDRDFSKFVKNAVGFGSAITDASGNFHFTYDDQDIASLKRGKTRLDLVVAVSAPDGEKGTPAERVLHFNDPPRFSAGKIENFSIGISPGTLEKFSLNARADVAGDIANYQRKKTDEKQFSAGVLDFHRAEVESDIAEKKVLRKDLIDKIATNLDLATFHGELVRENENIKDKINIVTDRAVKTADRAINGRPGEAESTGVPVNLYLLPEDLARLKPFFDAAVGGFATIPEFELLDVLARTNSSENPGTLLIHNNPIASYCGAQTLEEKCAKFHLSEPADPGGVPGDPARAGGIPVEPDAPLPQLTNENVKEIAARLTADMRPPGFVFGEDFSKTRATQEAIDKSVSELVLGKGPADVPAFYDFISLQVAFEHVWKVLVDEEIVNKVHALDKKYKQKAGVGLLDTLDHNLTQFTVLGIYNSIPQEVPPDVTAQFDITIQEWIDLSPSHRARVEKIAGQLSDVAFGPTAAMFRRERMRQDLREQGERIIDSVRHDDYYTLHKTLRDLHARINSAYEFTVFAADKNFHSVNFGLLNTYRQNWTPINYQAGELVRSIPLAPREEQTYTVKTTRNLKQVKKEAVKNNSSQMSKQSSTSRAESEIMEKAQNKTNFGLSTEGTYNIGISKGKSTTTFGVEAQNESSAHRKDMRESAREAAQEYKNETLVEVTSDESTSYEYSQSGKIVNPNDALSVTYLFYELQRTYRVSEQLYRVQPVVMVAQEVPAPHEITEAWVIANDWIINRFLLDDSFRPALDYLANKSVGDDFALRELRKNLRQQRNLVETLRIELSISSNEAENRYRALENAIERRIKEESAENSDGLFSDIGDFFGGGGQDSEAMKARELAAKDAHQYAADKAERSADAVKQEIANLHTLTSEYNTTLRNHLDNETRVKRLLSHLQANILYYMQAIWSMEPPDQRFLRLHKVKVPSLKLATVTDPNTGNQAPNRVYTVNVRPVADIFSGFRKEGTKKFSAFVKGVLMPAGSFEPRALVEVADLDSYLGCKGNYMIFPMKEHNALTEFMAAPYVDEAFGAMDPEELSNISLDDYAKFICCLHKREPEKFEALKDELTGWLKKLLADPLRNGDEIVVPTGSLFIESLVGTYPLLEKFKRQHREMDAFKVGEEVRRAQMENLRLAARLINAEREDPDIEKKIVVQGDPALVPVNPDV